MDLTVEVTEILTRDVIDALCAARDQPLLICDRCEDADEIVVATIHVLEATFALCGRCARDLPTGYRVA